MFARHQKSESERRRLIDISTIGVLFCLILVLYVFGERRTLKTSCVTVEIPQDTSRIVVISIEPDKPKPKELSENVSKEIGEIVQEILPFEPKLNPVDIDPKKIIMANIFSKVPVPVEDKRIYPDSMVQKKPFILHMVKPNYPTFARLTGQEGSVILGIVIDKNGELEHVSIHESNPLFNDAAVEAVRQFKFSPAYRDNHPVRVRIHIPFRFELK